MGLSARELIERCPTIASLPSIYHRLTEVMSDPYSSAADFGAIIQDDTGLTARLLQLVNSAFYGLPQKMDSVTQALSVVGTNQLHDLALATSVLTMFKNIPPELVDMESFWKHSLACGVAARTIATQRREPNVERLFVAGLLHDVGRLLILMANPDDGRASIERARAEQRLLVEVEREVMGYDHAVVGRLLMNAWGLPIGLQEPVGYHHDPKKAQRFPIETAIIHVGDIIAHALLLGNSGERFVPPLSPAAWYRLDGDDRLPLSTLDDIARQYDAAVQAILQPAHA
jgi:HD-like signal output (HDOD) protein